MFTFWLKIVASDHVFYNGYCSHLVVPAPDDEMSIMPHYEAMIPAVQEGNLRLEVPEETEWHQAIVGRETLQVVNNRVAMIVDIVEWPEDTDKVRVREALEHAQEQLCQKQSLREFKMSQVPTARTLTRLKGNYLKELERQKPSK